MSSPSASTAIGTTVTADGALPGGLPRGRFAPSPTGPLHFGSLVAAVGSYLHARSLHGQWLVRIEDLDPPRESPGASSAILRCLEAYGFEWDGAVLYQSTRLAAYQEALERLGRRGVIYPCICTRRRLRGLSVTAGQPVYPGTCRRRRPGGRAAAALRVLTDLEPVGFVDLVQGPYSQCLERDVGDFIVRRRDGLYAYQLAVVVDDHAQRITHVVRGRDLLDNTPRQLYLQRLLGLATPHYAHLPIVLTRAGCKLSKQTGAAPLDLLEPAPALCRALAFLGQDPPGELARGRPAEVWAWARREWRGELIPLGRPEVRAAVDRDDPTARNTSAYLDKLDSA